MKLDDNEKDLLSSTDNNEWKSVSNLSEQKSRLLQMAKRSSAKTKRITLRVTEHDYELAHVRAIQDGIPYQTLISSVIHRYLTGQLKENR